MESSSVIQIRIHGIDQLQKAVDVIAPEFYKDPWYRWFIREFDEDKRRELIHYALHGMLKLAAVAGVPFLEANDWSACMVVAYPGHKYDSVTNMLRGGVIQFAFGLGPRTFKRLFGEYISGVERAKSKVLASNEMRESYNVFVAATRAQHRKKGLLTALTTHLQEMAGMDGKPIWLEATTEYSRRQFLRLGFEDVETILLGENEVESDGIPRAGGEGFLMFGMIWWPRTAREQ